MSSSGLTPFEAFGCLSPSRWGVCTASTTKSLWGEDCEKKRSGKIVVCADIMKYKRVQFPYLTSQESGHTWSRSCLKPTKIFLHSFIYKITPTHPASKHTKEENHKYSILSRINLLATVNNYQQYVTFSKLIQNNVKILLYCVFNEKILIFGQVLELFRGFIYSYYYNLLLSVNFKWAFNLVSVFQITVNNSEKWSGFTQPFDHNKHCVK